MISTAEDFQWNYPRSTLLLNAEEAEEKIMEEDIRKFVEDRVESFRAELNQSLQDRIPQGHRVEVSFQTIVTVIPIVRIQAKTLIIEQTSRYDWGKFGRVYHNNEPVASELITEVLMLESLLPSQRKVAQALYDNQNAGVSGQDLQHLIGCDYLNPRAFRAILRKEGMRISYWYVKDGDPGYVEGQNRYQFFCALPPRIRQPK